MQTSNPARIVQITDTHLYEASDGTLLKMNTHDSLQYVLNMVKAKEPQIDLILATGDIAQDASEAAYRYFIEQMDGLSAPMRWIPGNHDVISVMNKVAGDSDIKDKLVRVNNWAILLLNTSVVGQVHGNLDDDELVFLSDSLAALQSDGDVEHILITMHHNPVQGNAGWMKDIGLHNEADFWERVKGQDKLRCILYGHVHQDLDFQHNGIRCLCTPSTCIQFKPDVVNFSLDSVNPGYRNLQLHTDGSIDTQVHRVEGFNFEVDFTSPGY